MKKLLLVSCLLLAVVPARLLLVLLMAGGLSEVEASFAQDNCFPARPSPARFVNNFSKELPDFLSSGEAQALESKLEQFNKATSNQIVIVIVDDLCGYDANEFSTRLGQAWGVGQDKFDNGVVLMVKPTGGAGKRAAYIAVGYGLEGAIPDVTANRILDNELLPRFKNGDFYNGLDAATSVLISLAQKEFSYTDYQKEGKNWSPFLIFIIIFIFIIFNSFRKRGYTVDRGGRRFYNRGFFGGMGGLGGGGGFGGGGSSFGGGGFGGGGAGGSW